MAESYRYTQYRGAKIMTPNWYVITGGPMTGKTKLIDELAKRGYDTVPEAARTVIDEAIKHGISSEKLRADEKRFQDDVAILKRDIEKTHDKKTLTFFDRGMHDTIAYLNYYDYNIEDWIVDFAKKASYRKVFLLEPVGEYTQDYARTEDAAFTKRIRPLLQAAYSSYGMEPIIIPDIGLENRVNFVLNTIERDAA